MVGLGDGLGSGQGTVGSPGDGHGVGDGFIVGDGFGSDGFGVGDGDGFGSDGFGVGDGDTVGTTLGETVGSVVTANGPDFDPSSATVEAIIPESKNANATADSTSFVSTLTSLIGKQRRVRGITIKSVYFRSTKRSLKAYTLNRSRNRRAN